jgi:glycosyltransferase involved in cell wall biosynthesis
MRLLQINCVFAAGSTGKIVYAIHEYAKNQGDEPYAIYGLGPRIDDPTVFRTTPWAVRKIQSFRSRITGYPYGGCIWGTARAIQLLKQINPDIVHVQCMNAYMVNIYRILEYLKQNHIPTVITNHAEFMYTGGCTHTVDCDKWLTGCHDCDKISKEHPISYFFDRTEQEWKLFQRAYDGFEKLTICCVSDWVRDRACQSPFYKGHPVITVLNGLDTNVFHHSDASELRVKLGLNGKKIVIHATPNFYSIIKGGQHVIEMAKRFPDVEFVILGSEAKDDTAPKNCRFMGKITDQRLLAQYYSMGDVCLLTSVRETFSMVCAESLCCGTTVVGFRAGGPETIALPDYSSFVEQGNDDELEEALGKMLDLEYGKKPLSEIAVKTYGQETMCKNYYEVYRNILR